MNAHEAEDIREAVRERYAGHAVAASSCCAPSCCGSTPVTGEKIGYDLEELAALPPDANLGLGCGNPLALESIGEGEVVVDLGSGGGLDCFLAARRVGSAGRVIGVDMTPEMVHLARRNADRMKTTNVEFRLGEIEHLPIEDGIADLIISNCVINLVPDKRRAFAEAFRVLKPGGRMSVADIVTTAPLPENVATSVGAYVACLGGASVLSDYVDAIRDSGFQDVHVVGDVGYAMADDETRELAGSLASQLGMTEGELAETAQLFRSVTVQAAKPL